MKKQLNKIVLLLLSVIVISSCESDDKAIEQVFDGVEYGAVLRNLGIINQSFSLSDPNSFFGITVEEQDEEYGALLDVVNVYTTYTDNNGNGNSQPEVLVKTYAAADFSIGDKGLPVTDIIVTLGEASAAAGIANYGVGDNYRMRLELVLTNGRTFSSESTSGSLQGSYFSSPFAWGVPILCQPVDGDYKVDMQDSFGDGWQTDAGNGGSGLKAILTLADGSESIVEVGMCSPYGSDNIGTAMDPDEGICTGPASTAFYSATAYVTIPEGTQLAVWQFPGDQYGEISFQIYGPAGNLLLDSGQAPGAGQLDVLNCL
jgi:hypothetical protein